MSTISMNVKLDQRYQTKCRQIYLEVFNSKIAKKLTLKFCHLNDMSSVGLEIAKKYILKLISNCQVFPRKSTT
jgi:hypothetical protein